MKEINIDKHGVLNGQDFDLHQKPHEILMRRRSTMDTLDGS